MINFILIACPITCPDNASCSCRTDICEKRCGDRSSTCPPPLSYCVNKCYCDDGFIRSSRAERACIPNEDCMWRDPFSEIEIAEKIITEH